MRVLDKIEEVGGREEEDRDGRVRDRDEKEREWFKAAVGIVGDTDPELVVLRPTWRVRELLAPRENDNIGILEKKKVIPGPQARLLSSCSSLSSNRELEIKRFWDWFESL